MGASAASDPAASDRTVSHDPAQPPSGAAATKTDGPPRSAHLSAISSDHLTERPIQKLLQDRLHMLDEHSKLTLALREATSPEVSPEHQAEQLKAELKQIQVMLAQADKNPQTLLPSSFHKAPGMAPPALVSEMKDAIDAATHELGEWKNKAETLKTGRADRENQKKARAVERDKVFKLVTAWTAKKRRIRKGSNRRSDRRRRAACPGEARQFSIGTTIGIAQAARDRGPDQPRCPAGRNPRPRGTGLPLSHPAR